MRPARLFRRLHKNNSNDTRWTLRAGRLGRGRVIHTCDGWDNPRSDEAAEDIMRAVAKREGFEIVTDEEAV